VKFKIKHSRPGSDISYSRDDPYGEIGFYSIKWYYGFMLLRPERLAIIKTVAEL
jgi:N4-gp56 family major capsid protein